jgi:putative redox protein
MFMLPLVIPLLEFFDVLQYELACVTFSQGAAMAVELSMTYDGQLQCTAVHDQSGTTLRTDAPKDNGGKGELFSPTDLVGVATGTCVLTIIALVAQRNGIDLTGATCHVSKEMTSAPRRVGSLDIKVTMPAGLNLSDEDKKRIESGGKMCPVKQSLHPDIALNLEYIYP